MDEKNSPGVKLCIPQNHDHSRKTAIVKFIRYKKLILTADKTTKSAIIFTCPPRIIHVPECRENASGAATATNLSSFGTTSSCLARWSLMWCRATCEPFRFSYSMNNGDQTWSRFHTIQGVAYHRRHGLNHTPGSSMEAWEGGIPCHYPTFRRYRLLFFVVSH